MVGKAQERIGEINFNYLKDFKSSQRTYLKLVNFTPRLERFDFYQFRYALSLHHDQSYSLSIKQFEKIQSNSSHEYFVASFYQLGITYFNQKKWKRAIFLWKEYLKREKRRDNIIQTKFLMGNAYETMENLKKAYDLYYSILGEYPNTEVLQNRLNAIYNRRVARKR